jgi:hypothetical protein
MSTGLETWNQNLAELGAVYPMVGTEVVLAFVGIASWIIWHLLQIKEENKVINEEDALFSDKEQLAKAARISNAQTLNEALEEHGKDYRHNHQS